MTPSTRHMVAGIGLAAALMAGASAPASAAPPHSTLATAGNVENVAYRHHHRWHRGYGPGFGAGAVFGLATAPLWAPWYGPGGYYGGPYAYDHRRGGQCMIDDGYGRTRPCSSGDAP